MENVPMPARFLSVLGLLLLAAALGCAGGPCDLTGTVRYRGRPLPSGTITFLAADGGKAYSAIGSAGRYSVRGVARGTARVAVESHPRVPEGFRKAGGGGPPPGPEEKAVEIPPRYAKPESSGLTVEVEKRRQTHDIDLAP
jgi:hypothetical protein